MTQLHLFNPINGIKTATTYELIEGITGKNYANLCSLKSKGMKIGSINSYIIDDNMPKEKLHDIMRNEVIKGEIWKFVEESAEKYQVSNYGRVRRMYKKLGSKIVIPYIKNDYLRLKVTLNGKIKEVSIHWLVAKHFIENDNPKVNTLAYHKNENIFDNFAGNLKWISRKELGKLTGGKANAIAVIKLDPVTLEELDNYESMADAGRKNYVHRETIRQCINGELKTAGGFKWIEDKDFAV